MQLALLGSAHNQNDRHWTLAESDSPRLVTW